jgi:hypothetical protein
MKCWDSAFNARGFRVPIVPRYTVTSSENICNRSGGAEDKGKTGWNSVYQ